MPEASWRGILLLQGILLHRRPEARACTPYHPVSLRPPHAADATGRTHVPPAPPSFSPPRPALPSCRPTSAWTAPSSPRAPWATAWTPLRASRCGARAWTTGTGQGTAWGPSSTSTRGRRYGEGRGAWDQDILCVRPSAGVMSPPLPPPPPPQYIGQTIPAHDAALQPGMTVTDEPGYYEARMRRGGGEGLSERLSAFGGVLHPAASTGHVGRH